MSFKPGRGTQGGKVTGAHDICAPELKDTPELKNNFIKIIDRELNNHEYINEEE